LNGPPADGQAVSGQRLEADDMNGVCIVMQDPEGNEFCLD
jgi:hypothetical protein